MLTIKQILDFTCFIQVTEAAGSYMYINNNFNSFYTPKIKFGQSSQASGNASSNRSSNDTFRGVQTIHSDKRLFTETTFTVI